MHTMRDRKLRRNLLVTTLFALLIPALAFNIPFPVDKEISAIEINLDDVDYIVDCKIRMEGYYHINLFKQDVFYGQVSVSDYSWTNEKMKSPLYLNHEDGSLLEYNKRVSSSILNHQELFEYRFGRILVEFYMGNPIILVYSKNPVDKSGGAAKTTESLNDWGSWATDNGYCIISGVDNRDDAIKTLIRRDIL